MFTKIELGLSSWAFNGGSFMFVSALYLYWILSFVMLELKGNPGNSSLQFVPPGSATLSEKSKIEDDLGEFVIQKKFPVMLT
jgi:hypothetical protein